MKRAIYSTLFVFYILAFANAQETDPKATEVWEPVPEKVVPGAYQYSSAPSDAIVLFDGTDLSQWKKPKYTYEGDMKSVREVLEKKIPNIDEGTPPEWEVKDGAMIVKPRSGPIETIQKFGDMQLHLEFLSPYDPGKKGQQYSNSGVFLMGIYEVQVLNSYENTTYPNGQAGAVYKQHIPLVNASRPPGEWQTYDMVFMTPKFNEDGSLKSPATLTVFHNGVLIQNNVSIEGPWLYIGKPSYIPHPEKMPLLLQDHGDKVRFRNIWVREI